MSDDELQQLEELEEERGGSERMEEIKEASEIIASARKHAIRSAYKLAGNLNELIKEGHATTAFMIALTLAFAKDALDIVLDLVIVGEIPILGQIPGMFLSAFLFFFLWGKGMFKRIKIRYLLYFISLFFDNLPLVNDIPMNTLVVLYAWHVISKKAKEAEEKLKNLQKETGQNMEDAETEEFELEEEAAVLEEEYA